MSEFVPARRPDLPSNSRPITTHFRACHLCEAICGLEIQTEGTAILSIKGDKSDPFSRGHICPKAVAIQDIHEDPDRLRKPVKKTDQGWEEVEWQQAFDEIAERLSRIQQSCGDSSVAVYAGNPNVHNYGSLTHGRVFRKALGTKNNFSATSLDQLPHHLLAMLMYGHQFLVPVPDIDRTQYMLIFGANPVASNGSMMTVPDVKKRLKEIQAREGKVVVVDPRYTETAELADQHVFVKPGTDAWVLLALLNQVIRHPNASSDYLGELSKGFDRDKLERVLLPFTPDRAEKLSGVSASTIEQIADQFCRSDSAVCYGRMGVSVQAYGSLCQWAIQLINLFSGNLDRPGGAMFPSSAVGYVQPGEPSPGHYARARSRVSGLPSFSGEFPATILAEEMLTEGEGQIKALVTIAGNPVLSSPNGQQLDKALASLECMVAIDIYVNETTQHADYILPPTSPLEHDHYDLAFLRLAVRNVSRFNEPVFEKPEGALHDWEILNGLGAALAKIKGNKHADLPPPHLMIDMGLQMGPYGKGSDRDEPLSLALLKNHPHGVDLGPMVPGLASRICTESREIEILPDLMLSETQRLLDSENEASAETNAAFPLRLIGRRDVRSNNSWMHNSHRLVKGKARWQCLVHPSDLESRGIRDGQSISISSRVGEVVSVAKASDEVMTGVVCMPHGWGHQRSGVELSVASQHEAPSMNDLTDHEFYDKSTGNAALNGVPVQVSALE